MKMINTTAHGAMDYLMGAFLIGAPWLFNFYRGGYESSVPMMVGIATILYSLITDYELGLGKAISMRTHLILDVVAAVFLMASPWLFGFYHSVYLPHVIVGAVELIVVAFSSSDVYHSHSHKRTFGL